MSKSAYKCCGLILSMYRSYPCGKNAKFERGGKHYCGIHDPVTVAEKQAKKNAEWKAKWQANIDADAARRRSEALQQHKANCFDELLALLVESQTSIGGDWRQRRDAAIAKAVQP